MTIESTLHCLKVMVEEENCENCPCYGETGTDHCEKDAVRMSIASLEAWERVKDDIHEYETDCLVSADCADCKDCNVVMFKSIYQIINKHLQEAKSG